VTRGRGATFLGVIGSILLALWWIAVLSCEHSNHQELKLHPDVDLGCGGAILLSRIPIALLAFVFGLIASWRTHKAWLLLSLAALLSVGIFTNY
jgi:hypothetical protein